MPIASLAGDENLLFEIVIALDVEEHNPTAFDCSLFRGAY
jgi:hypothetical protein